MIRYVFISAFMFMFFLSSGWAQTSDEKSLINHGDVRGFIWGLPTKVVQENEAATFIVAEDDRMLFRGGAFGMPATIVYEFRENKLNQARIFIEKSYTDQQKRIDDLMTIRADLVARYGEPLEEDFKWRNKSNIDYPDAWGWSVYRGELFITLKFQDQQTDVTVFLGNQQPYEPQFSVTYQPRQAKTNSTKEPPASGLLF